LTFQSVTAAAASLRTPGLPDFSRHNIPKTGKIYQNDQDVYHMAIKINEMAVKLNKCP
jgi:hypothetical protein